MLVKCVSGNQFFKIFWKTAPWASRLRRSRVTDSAGRPSADFNPVLSGKHARVPPIEFTPYASALEVSAFGASFRLRADDSRSLCLNVSPFALASVLSFTPKSAKPIWNFRKQQLKFFTEVAFSGFGICPTNRCARDLLPRTRDKSQVKQTSISCRQLTRATKSCCRQSLMISAINYSSRASQL